MTRSSHSRTGRGRILIGALWRPAVVSMIVGASALMALSAATAAPRARGGAQTVLSSHKSDLGWQLVVEMNDQKLSLYVRVTGKSSCYGRFSKVWLPVFDRGRIVVANRSCHRSACRINRKRLGTLRRKGGSLQVTYHGQPLYRYYKDKKTGQTQGQGKDQAGGAGSAILTDGNTSCKGLHCGY